MLTSKKTRTWQIKTIEGAYYQQSEIKLLLKWILENRIGAQDLLYSDASNNWVPLFSVGEFSKYFVQLKIEGSKTYGPLSFGELKQLFENKQINGDDQISSMDSIEWVKIKNYVTLYQWILGEKDIDAFINFSEGVIGVEEEIVEGQDAEEIVKDKEGSEEIAMLTEEKEALKREVEKLRQIIDDYDSDEKNLGADAQKRDSLLEEKEAEIEKLSKYLAQMEVNSALNEERVLELTKTIERQKSLITQKEVEEKSKVKEKDVEFLEFEDKIESVRKVADETLSKQASQYQEEKRLREEEIKSFKSLLEEKSKLHEDDNKLRLEEIELLIVENKKLRDEMNSYRDQLSLGQVGENKLKKKNEELSLKDNEIEKITSENNEAKKVLELKNKEIISLVELKNTLLNEIALGDEKASEGKDMLTLENESLKKQIDENGQLIEKLESENKLLGSENSSLKNDHVENEDSLKREIAEKEVALSAMSEELEKLKSDINVKSEKLESENIEKEYLNETLTKLNAEFEQYARKEKERYDTLVVQKESIEKELMTGVGKLESERDELKEGFDKLELGYKESLNNVSSMEQEIVEKTRLIQSLESDKSAQYEELKSEIYKKESRLSELTSQLEGLYKETEKLQERLSVKEDEAGNLKETVERLSNEFNNFASVEKKKYEELEGSSKRNADELVDALRKVEEENGVLQAEKEDLMNIYNALLGRVSGLEQQVAENNEYIHNIESEKAKQYEFMNGEINERNEKLNDALENIEELERQMTSLNMQMEKVISEKEAGSENILRLNEEMREIKSLYDIQLEEKEKLSKEVSTLRDIKESLGTEVAELKQNWESAIEENRTLQKEFYVEKQRMIKEYTEVISKQAKLEKKAQIEKEINDRTIMRSDLERLLSFVTGNLQGMQKGASELESSLLSMQDEIDKRKLSLKHMSEAEKRQVKKNNLTSFSKEQKPAEESTQE